MDFVSLNQLEWSLEGTIFKQARLPTGDASCCCELFSLFIVLLSANVSRFSRRAKEEPFHFLANEAAQHREGPSSTGFAALYN